MENHSPEKTFENRMDTNISIEDLRNNKAYVKLSLRKEKRNKNMLLNLREKINIMYESHYNIHLNLLKTNNEDIRNFSINTKNPEESMDKLKYLLTSKDDNKLKYGLYATRKFFQNLVRELYYHEGEGNMLKISKDQIKTFDDFGLFIKNNIINILFDILNNNINKNDNNSYINIYEIIWTFINMGSIYPKENNLKNEFFKIVLMQNNLNILINLININIPPEITNNVLMLINNIILEEENIYIQILINSTITQTLMEYLKINKKINHEILVKIYKLLFNLYHEYNNLNIEAYKILFKIFSLPLYTFNDKEILEYCLRILLLLSEIKEPQIENCFNNMDLFSALNNIIFDHPIKDNEILINLILDIFTNLIVKNNIDLQRDIINSGSLIIFYNNLLNKYKNEGEIKDYKIDENILVSVNNLILLGGADVVKYVMGEGFEIMNSFIESAKSVFIQTKIYGIKSFLNILMNENNNVDIKIIYDMVNIIIDIFHFVEFNKCYYNCIKVLFLIIEKSEKMNFKNELKNYLNNKGFINNMEKLEIELLNNSKNIKLDDSDTIENYLNIIDEIKYFLNN